MCFYYNFFRISLAIEDEPKRYSFNFFVRNWNQLDFLNFGTQQRIMLLLLLPMQLLYLKFLINSEKKSRQKFKRKSGNCYITAKMLRLSLQVSFKVCLKITKFRKYIAIATFLKADKIYKIKYMYDYFHHYHNMNLFYINRNFICGACIKYV